MSIATETRKSSDGIAYMPTSATEPKASEAKARSNEDDNSKANVGPSPKTATSRGDQEARVANRGESANEDSGAKAREKRDGETLVGYSKDDLIKEGSAKTSAPADQVAEPLAAPKPAASIETERGPEVTKIAGNISVPTWALIAAASIGILFVLFFLYQMIFERH